MTRLQLKGIYFENIDTIFDEMIVEGRKGLDLSWGKYIELVDKGIAEIIESYDKNIIDTYVNQNKFTLDKFLEISSKNQSTIVKENGELFKFFIMYINYSQILFEKCRISVGRKRISQTLRCTIALYGIINRKAQQINSMLMEGYIDGAMIIWRSLYENVIAAITNLNENDEELTLKFKAHGIRNSRKKLESYIKNYKDLKFKPPTKANLEKLRKQEELISEKYGKEFMNQEFGWADELFPGKQKANLRELEMRLNLTRFRPYYLMCSEHIHLGYNTFNDFRISGKINLASMNFQELDFKKFIDPMQFTTAIIHEISDRLLYEVSVASEYNVNSEFMRTLHKKIIEAAEKMKISTST